MGLIEELHKASTEQPKDGNLLGKLLDIVLNTKGILPYPGKDEAPSLREMPGWMLGNITNKGRGILSSGELTMDMNPKSAFGTQEGRLFQAPIIDPALSQIEAYHGSPHKFKKFSLDKIGTGEGAQAFGYGLYFTDKPSIAKDYARKLAKSADFPEANRAKLPKSLTASEFNEMGTLGQKMAKQGNLPEGEMNRWRELNKLHKKYMKAVEELGPQPRTYKATLHKGKTPGEYDYLEWDKPVTSKVQLDKIRKQAEKEGVDLETLDNLNPEALYTGNEIYWELANKGTASLDHPPSAKEASLFLLRSGIDGIKYPAGTLSGGTKDNAYNYVVFDENAITIEGTENE